MTVYDYACAVGLKVDPQELMGIDELNSLKNMPIDSACGQDCKKAIDACVSLVNVIRQAFGNDSPEEDEIDAATMSAVLCFING